MEINKVGLVYSYKEQPQMQAEVILASASTTVAKNIYTIRVRYPRPIHGEIMTHRVFGRNARSSRAVPVKTMLNEVRDIPYVPWHWGKNQKGMQADEECNTDVIVPDWVYEPNDDQMIYGSNTLSREEAWLHLRDHAADVAEGFMEAGYHKQNPNRLLEPFSWIDTLITSTEWDNFFWLRQHGAAEPHLIDLANLMHTAIKETRAHPLPHGHWHLPYINDDDWFASDTDAKPEGMTCDDFLLNVSAARCARISYTPFDGDPSYERELQRANLLMNNERVHASPFEHQAKPDEEMVSSYHGHFVGWKNPDLHGNLNGWIQARKLIPNEVYSSK